MKKKSDNFDAVLQDHQAQDNPLFPSFKSLCEAHRKLSRSVDKLTDENSRMVQLLTDLQRSLNLASRIDPLTGLPNRRDMMERITQEYSRAQRHKRSFCLVILDVDYFQLINDSYGYNTGDDVLIELSRVLMGTIRNEDLCARWGGEEFMVLLPETEIEGALAVAQKIHESVAMTEFKANNPGIRITVSLGISEYSDENSLQECIREADNALKMAKKAGKNRYIVASRG